MHLIRITQLTSLAGVTSGQLRAWEDRYGWPQPTKRGVGGVRYYVAEIADQVKRVLTWQRAGFALGDLLRPEGPQFPVTLVEAPPRPARDWSQVPDPRSAEARRLRQQIVRAVEQGSTGLLERCKAERARIHPLDRPAIDQALALAEAS
jgi:DNA-binding transcriptional MerR regulator